MLVGDTQFFKGLIVEFNQHLTCQRGDSANCETGCAYLESGGAEEGGGIIISTVSVGERACELIFREWRDKDGQVFVQQPS